MESAKSLADVTVIVPVYQEEKAVGFVLNEIISTGLHQENIIVVDGGSKDRTVEIAKSIGVTVVFQRGKGKADAVKTGLELVKTPYLLVMDGDGTYPAKYIPRLLELAKKSDCDLVIGVRVYGKESQRFLFRLGNKILTTFFNMLFGVKLKDVLSGMYLAKTEKMKEIGFEMKGFSVEAETVAHFANLGYKICEEPIEYRPRIDPRGKKLRVFHGPKIAIDMVRLTWRYNPAFFILGLGALLLIPGLVLGAWVGYHYLFTGVKYYVKGLIAILLTLTGFTSAVTAIMALYVKRIEIRLNKKFEEIRREIRNLANNKHD